MVAQYTGIVVVALERLDGKYLNDVYPRDLMLSHRRRVDLIRSNPTLHQPNIL